MNEMKPEDVMKALECCLKLDCKSCPYSAKFKGQKYLECGDVLLGDALALLRENDEQIFKLENRLKECENGYAGTLFLESCKLHDAERKLAEKDAEIERLYKNLNETAKEQYINGRAEAITEFAELWKKWWYGQIQVGVNAYQESIIYDAIDQIAKEMKGN